MKERPKSTEDGIQSHVFERKIKFSPFGVTSLQKEDFEGERRGYWTSKVGDPFDPTYRVEKCEMPNFLLEKVLPADILNPPSPQPKSKITERKVQMETNDTAQSPAVSKRHRIADTATNTPQAKPPHIRTTPKAVLSSNNKQSASWIHGLIELSDSDEELRLPPSRLTSGSSAKPAPPRVIDLGSPSSEEESRPRAVPSLAPRRQMAQQTPSRMNQDKAPDLGLTSLRSTMMTYDSLCS